MASIPLFRIGVSVAVILLSALIAWENRMNSSIDILDVARNLSSAYMSNLGIGQSHTIASQPLLGVTVVITGATSGIGHSLASVLYKLGATVVVLGRNTQRLKNLEEELQAGEGIVKRVDRLYTIVADNSDLSSIAEAADAVALKVDRIDFLINNAGMHYLNSGALWKLWSNYTTVQGHDLAFGVNYLSHFLLTEKLLPLLQRSDLEARIIQVSSSFHWQSNGADLVPDIKTSMPMAASGAVNTYAHRSRSYANSKLAQIWHARSMAREIGKINSTIKVISVCPAWVATNIVGPPVRWFAFPANGAGINSVLNAMFQPGLGHNTTTDFVSNVHMKKLSTFFCAAFSTRLGSINFVRDHLTLAAAFSLLVLQPFLFDRFVLELSSPESYDERGQSRLYQWSKNEVSEWI